MIQRSSLFAALMSVALTAGAWAAPIVVLFQTVTNTDDSGTGSLRSAIINANAGQPNATQISFDIPGSPPFVIQPQTELPGIAAQVFILGDSQPGFVDTPVIELDGSLLGIDRDGLNLFGGGSIVRSLAIHSWDSSGIFIDQANNCTIEDCHIGVDPSGTAARPNLCGINIVGASGCTVGPGNLISGQSDPPNVNFSGIHIVGGGGNTIIGNRIGTDVTGTVAIPNEHGVWIETSAQNVIGGVASGEGNLISGNRVDGVRLEGTTVTNTTVEGNLIGTDVSGTFAMGNIDFGINIIDSPGNLIGGPTPGARNVISGNGRSANDAGINIQGASATANLIRGNFIGTDITGTLAIQNANGVHLLGADDCIVGGPATGEGNLISGNSLSGVQLSGAEATTVQGNLIGTDVTGCVALGNGCGITLGSAPRNLVGGSTPEERNVISGNLRDGILIVNPTADTNQISANFIGTDVTGLIAVPNGLSGVEIDKGRGNVIGGLGAERRNVISGNSGVGVSIHGVNATLNSVSSNFIGLDATGMAALPNLQGIEIYDQASETRIGGQGPALANVISGNVDDGVIIHSSATANKVQSNLIGTDASGEAAIGNGGDGVLVLSFGNEIGDLLADSNLIAHSSESGVEINGADNLIARNTIFGSTESGVDVVGGQGNTISMNSIFDNGGLGIDLGQDGVTLNPTVTPNTQPNDAQPYPVITGFELSPTILDVEGRILDAANILIDVELFSSPVCDISGFGEGQNFLGGTAFGTNASGEGSFGIVVDLDGITLDRFFTVTATGPDGSTSEFSLCFDPDLTGPTTLEVVEFLLGLRPNLGNMDVNGDDVVDAADVVARVIDPPEWDQ